jgi:predicted anti-sigma-YlaC factor YlaD
VTSCQEVRELLSAFFEAELDSPSETLVQTHLDSCPECSEIVETMQLITDAVTPLQDLRPPEHLGEDLVSSACRRWLGLLFRAVDRDIDEKNLARLLQHLESCPSCRTTWNDLALISQVSDAMTPPPQLLQRCIAVRNPVRRRPIMGKRAATAAAYLLALLGSLVIGNPITIARQNPVKTTVQTVAETLGNEVSDAAELGRGEARVMLWRAWRWSGRQVAAVRDMLQELQEEDDDSDSEQGGPS